MGKEKVMLDFVATIHVLTCIVIIGFVLLQGGSEGGGGLFGGTGSHGIIGATSADNVLVKITKYAALILAATSIGLTAMYNQQRASVLQKGTSGEVDISPFGAANPPSAPADADDASTGESPAKGSPESPAKDSPGEEGNKATPKGKGTTGATGSQEGQQKEGQSQRAQQGNSLGEPSRE